MGYRDPVAKKSFAYPFPAIALTIMGALKLATRVKVSRILIFAKPKSDKVWPDGFFTISCASRRDSLRRRIPLASLLALALGRDAFGGGLFPVALRMNAEIAP